MGSRGGAENAEIEVSFAGFCFIPITTFLSRPRSAPPPCFASPHAYGCVPGIPRSVDVLSVNPHTTTKIAYDKRDARTEVTSIRRDHRLRPRPGTHPEPAIQCPKKPLRVLRASA
jgi:hypothetical protein